MINKIKSLFNKEDKQSNQKEDKQSNQKEETQEKMQEETNQEPVVCCGSSSEKSENTSSLKPQDVNAETVLGDILNIEGATEILQKYNLPCLSCPMSAMEMGILKLGEVSNMYGLDMEKIIEEIHKL